MKTWCCILLIIICCISTTSALDGYNYCQDISYTACDQEIYQQDFVIHRSTGDPYEEISGGLNITHLYLDDHCQVDYGDIRFTNQTGDELSYYLWPDFDNESAKFCVRLTEATSAGEVLVWYGNSVAETTSDRLKTFETISTVDFCSGGTPSAVNSYSSSYYPSKACDNSVSTTSRWIAATTSSSTGWWQYYKSSGGIVRILRYYPLDTQIFKDFIFSGSNDGSTWTNLRSGMQAANVGEEWQEWDINQYNTTYKYYRITYSSKQDTTGNVGAIEFEFLTVTDNLMAVLADSVWMGRSYSAAPPTASDFSGEFTTGGPMTFPGYDMQPTDPDADGLYEDVNGNGRLDFQDIMIFFQYNAWAQANQPNVSCFDWSGNGAIEFSDVQKFWESEFT